GVFDRFMEHDFGQGRLHVERAIPGAPLSRIEAAALWARVGKRRVDDAKIGHAEYELVYAYAGQAASFGAPSLVGGVVEREKISQVIGAFGQWAEHRIFLVGKTRRQETAGVELAYQRNGRQRRHGQDPRALARKRAGLARRRRAERRAAA